MEKKILPVSSYQTVINLAGAIISINRGVHKSNWFDWSAQAEVATDPVPEKKSLESLPNQEFLTGTVTRIGQESCIGVPLCGLVWSGAAL